MKKLLFLPKVTATKRHSEDSSCQTPYKFPEFPETFSCDPIWSNHKNTNEISENFREINPGNFRKLNILCD